MEGWLGEPINVGYVVSQTAGRGEGLETRVWGLWGFGKMSLCVCFFKALSAIGSVSCHFEIICLEFQARF